MAPLRLSRKNYWIRLALYTLAYVVAIFAARPWPAVSTAISIFVPAVWMYFIAGPRLRDFGQTGWWSIIPFTSGFVAGFAKGAHLIDDQIYATALLFIGIGSLLFMAVLGAIPGQAGPNRFGPPQGAPPVADQFT